MDNDNDDNDDDDEWRQVEVSCAKVRWSAVVSLSRAAGGWSDNVRTSGGLGSDLLRD